MQRNSIKLTFKLKPTFIPKIPNVIKFLTNNFSIQHFHGYNNINEYSKY